MVDEAVGGGRVVGGLISVVVIFDVVVVTSFVVDVDPVVGVVEVLRVVEVPLVVDVGPGPVEPVEDEAVEVDEVVAPPTVGDDDRPLRLPKSMVVTSGRFKPLVGGMVLSWAAVVDVGKTSVRTEDPPEPSTCIPASTVRTTSSAMGTNLFKLKPPD